jgi:hypothetical protein
MTMTYFKPLFVVCTLLAACDPPSTNVGELPTGTETDAGATEGATETSQTDTESASAEDTSAGSSTGADPSTDTESSTGPVAGGCLDESYECFKGSHEPLDCGGEPVCETLEVNDPFLNEFDEEPFGFVNPNAATCIFEGLAAGTVGAYRIRVEPGQQNSIDHRLEVLADGSVVVRREFQEDKSCSGSEHRRALQPAAYFEACQAEADDALVLECLLGAGDAEACTEDGATCP